MSLRRVELARQGAQSQAQCSKLFDFKDMDMMSDACSIKTSDELEPLTSFMDSRSTFCDASFLNSDDAPESCSADKISTGATPDGSAVVDPLSDLFESADALQTALLNVEHALNRFAHVVQLNSTGSPMLEQLSVDVQAIRKNLSERVVPEVAANLAACSTLPSTADGITEKPSVCQEDHDVRGEPGTKKESFRRNRPAPLDLKLPLGSLPRSESLPDEGVVTGSPRRLRDPLKELMKYNKKKDLNRTLAVSDVTKLGPGSLDSLRSHMEIYGEVELILQPRLSWAPGFALVLMRDADAVDRIEAAGESHLLCNLALSVRRLENFMADLEVQCSP